MAWIPKYKISGGMYGGSLCPAGSFTELSQVAPNFYFDSYLAFINGGYNNEMQDYKDWDNPYGMPDSLLRTYLMGHDDNEQHTFDLIEIDVKNPEGAQFYKQSIVFKATVKATRETVQSTDPQYSDLHMLYYEVAITSICRREYPTPYSTYTDTVLSGGGQAGLNGHYYIDGTKELGGWFYELTTNLLIPIGTLVHEGKEYFGAGFFQEHERTDSYNEGWWTGVIAIDTDVLDEQFGLFDPEEKEDPNEDDDEDDDPGPGHGGSGGGNGGYELPDYPITIPPKPVIGPCSVSWLTTYMMSAQDLDDFGQDLVNPDAIQKLKQFFNDPLDAIVGITMCPAVAGPRYSKTPTIHGTVPYEWSRSFMAILNQYVDIDCGIVRIDPFWDSCFDFDPYTRFSLFLPFIGYRDINADEIMGTNVHIVYRIDVVTGDCTAFVTKAAPSESMYGPMPDQIIGQFNGNCGVSVPIGRVNKDAAMQASFSLLAGAIGMGVGGAAAAAGLVDSSDLSEGQLASQVTHSTMTAVNAMKTKIERSGAISGNTGYLGYLRPYFIRKLARQSRPDNYKEIMGYPCNKPGPLRNYRGTGLAVVEDIQLNNIPAFGDELAEIISLLKGGVII